MDQGKRAGVEVSEQFTTEQRVYLAEVAITELRQDMKDLKGVLNRILWALITLILTILGSVATVLIIAGGG